MGDFGRVARKSLAASAVLLFDEAEHLDELGHGLFGGGHQGVASGDRRDFGQPAVRLVPIDHELIVLEAHELQHSPAGRGQTVTWAAYSMGSPKGFMPFSRTVLGNWPVPQRMNEPKSLYQSPSGA